MKKFLMLMMTLTIAITLAACGDNSNNENGKENENAEQPGEEAAEQAEEMEMTDEEKVDEEKVVASVNDAEVKGKEYNPVYENYKMQMAQMGQDTGNPESMDNIKNMTLDALINNSLVEQGAEENNVEVSEDEKKERLNELEEQMDEAGIEMSDFLEQNQFSDEKELEEQVVSELKLQKYLEEESSKQKVSDEEAKEEYDNIKQGNEDMPDFDDVKKEIKEQLKQEKLLEKLKDSAKIDKKI